MQVSIIPYGSRFAAIAANGRILATHIKKSNLENIVNNLYRFKRQPSDPNPSLHNRPVGSILFTNKGIILQSPKKRNSQNN